MWDAISKPPQYAGSRIEDFFDIQYAALPHYEEKYDDFIADSIVLRRRRAHAYTTGAAHAEIAVGVGPGLLVGVLAAWPSLRAQCQARAETGRHSSGHAAPALSAGSPRRRRVRSWGTRWCGVTPTNCRLVRCR
jgi:hypothetical protein